MKNGTKLHDTTYRYVRPKEPSQNDIRHHDANTTAHHSHTIHTPSYPHPTLPLTNTGIAYKPAAQSSWTGPPSTC